MKHLTSALRMLGQNAELRGLQSPEEEIKPIEDWILSKAQKFDLDRLNKAIERRQVALSDIAEDERYFNMDDHN